MPYLEPGGKASRYAIASADGRWTVAKFGTFPDERYEVWERTGERIDGDRAVAVWTRRGDHPSAEAAKMAVMASNAVLGAS